MTRHMPSDAKEQPPFNARDYSDTRMGNTLMLASVHWDDRYGRVLPHTTEVHAIVKALAKAGFDPNAE
jgi:hypothetical protein